MSRRPSIVRLSAVLALAAAAGVAQAGPDHQRAGAAHAAETTPLRELVPFEQPDLWIGSDAPGLAIAEFVKGESVHAFEEDRVYVVEFWATWCGPCIRAFPHLSELQKEHADDVTFIGVNIWERPGETQAAKITRIKDFVEEQGDRMGYTVAVEADGKMAEHWMKAANQNGIPAAFIVDGAGKVAWMGHPMGIDEPLESVIEGTNSYEKTAAEIRESSLMMAAYQKFMQDIASEDAATAKMAYRIADALAAESDNAGLLNAVAWTIIDEDGRRPIPHRDFEAGYRIATLAGEASEWKDPSILDTVALAAFKVGDRNRAIELQEKAIGLLPDGADASEYEDRLEMFKSEG
ncbi:MAG: redoxin family protein [Phycisphaerales bacterium]